MKSAIIISASSDIGCALSEYWLSKKFNLCGTYRVKNENLERLSQSGMKLFKCDLSSSEEISIASSHIIKSFQKWDILVLGAGLLDPIGSFEKIDFNEWEKSVKVNFISQLRMVQSLLPHRNREGHLEPLVLFFAGGGTNGAPENYSSYTVSKIALIKMCELLDAEIQDVRFSIIGPGWVKTKIHESTFNAKESSGQSYLETLKRYEENHFVSMGKVIACCDWLIEAPRSVVSGRNFSVEHDFWGDKRLDDRLEQDSNMYKLRRAGNNWKPA